MDDLLRDDDEMNDTISLESGDVDLIAVSTVTLEADRTPDDLATPEAARPFGGGGLEWEGGFTMLRKEIAWLLMSSLNFRPFTR